MQLDRSVRKGEKYQHQVQKSREISDRLQNSHRFEKMMANRLKSIDDTLRTIEARIGIEVERRVQNIMTSDSIKNFIDGRVAEIMETQASTSSASSDSDLETVESESSLESGITTCSSRASSTCVEPPTSDADDMEPSCSEVISAPIMSTEYAQLYPNKWEFIASFQQNGEITDFSLDQFTNSVRQSLKLPTEQEVFPRMSLEEMIERDHPTTSDSKLFDEKKITSKSRPQGKDLIDEEFFCLAPCCSGMRLFQAESYTFLPPFVRDRLKQADNLKVTVQKRADGIELITPVRWQNKEVQPIIPVGVQKIVPPTSNIDSLDKEQKEMDSFADRKMIEQSNLGHSYMELYAQLDTVPIDEKYGRLQFDPMGN